MDQAMGPAVGLETTKKKQGVDLQSLAIVPTMIVHY